MGFDRVMLPFYHPTTVILIDDDPGLLASLEHALGERFCVRSFTDPAAAVAFAAEGGVRVDNQERAISALARSANRHPDGSARLYELLCSHIGQLRANPERFALPSVAVVDFSMPGENGLAVCARLRSTRVSRILLTGLAVEGAALKAFNDRLIDRFLSKYEDELVNKLCGHIDSLQQSYFHNAGAALSYVLCVESLSFLRDASFLSFFGPLCKSRGVTEYYARCEPPGLEIVDSGGSAQFLLVLTDAEMEARWQAAVNHGADPSLLDKMASRGFVAQFPSDDGSYEPRFKSAWQMHVWPATPIPGAQDWFAAVVPMSSVRPVGVRSSVSFSDYRKRS